MGITTSFIPIKVVAQTNESTDLINDEEASCGEIIVITVMEAEDFIKTEAFKKASKRNQEALKSALEEANKLMVTDLMCGTGGGTVVSPELKQAIQSLRKAIDIIKVSTVKDTKEVVGLLEKINVNIFYNNNYAGKFIKFNLVDKENNILEKFITNEHGQLTYTAYGKNENKNLILKIDDSRFKVTKVSCVIETNKDGKIVKLNGKEITKDKDIYILK